MIESYTVDPMTLADESLAEQKIKALERELGQERALTSVVAKIRAIFRIDLKKSGYRESGQMEAQRTTITRKKGI